jgi:DNA-binding NarL/FixJ family response regulator
VTATRRVRNSVPSCRVIVLTNYDEDELVFSSIRAGASGYLLKETITARLGAALRGVLRGEAALPRELTARLVREFRARARSREARLARRGRNDLSRREWEVLDCLCDGLSTRRTAQRLFISETTVRRHIGSILRKLNVASRQAAVDLAAQRSENLNAQ